MSTEQKTQLQFIDWLQDEEYILEHHVLDIHQLPQLGKLCELNFNVISLLDDLNVQILIVPNKQWKKYHQIMEKEKTQQNIPLVLSFTMFLSCVPQNIQLIILKNMGFSKIHEQLNVIKNLDTIYIGDQVFYHDLHIPWSFLYVKMSKLGYQIQRDHKKKDSLTSLRIGSARGQFISLIDFLNLQPALLKTSLHETINKYSQHSHSN